MKTQWQIVIKPAFLNDIAKLQAKDVLQIMEKITMLTEDPRPDSKVKKHLTHCEGKPYRIRSGDYRIFYTFNQQLVTIYKIDRRHEGTYKDCPEAEYGPDSAELDELASPSATSATTATPQPDWEHIFSKSESSRPLPEPITSELLKQLQVPEKYHPRLLLIKDQDALLCCPGVDDSTLLKIDEYLFEPPLVQVMQQQDLVLNEVNDLLRYKEGELLAFLLKLSPEQEKYASWSLNTAGPALVKGGPGTGKSTVALYRIRSLLSQLHKTGKGAPHILFTTYTNALIKSSQQLLQQLLGPDARYVKVDTADRVAYSILNSCGRAQDYAILDEHEELARLTRQAISETHFSGNALQKQAQQQTIDRIGLDYLLQEFNTIIVARQLSSLVDYQSTTRAGRKLRLNATQRAAVWQVYTHWQALLHEKKQETWHQRRARAVLLVTQSPLAQHYDAVIIDEAQDLDPSALRLLVQLCKAPNRLFITADANQSIYGSGFAWSDVHTSLKFQGRTSILHANYRSTAEIGEAAQSYLAYAQLEPEESERQYVNNGPQPDARTVLNSFYEAQLLAQFFRKASRSFRFTLSSCAILCPSESAGKALEAALKEQSIEATFMTGQELNLARSGVKIITLKSSKGLEFPIVALAGFTAGGYLMQAQDAAPEKLAEALERERRTIFVGMTRAMRALLVVIPHNNSSPLLEGFDATHWNFTRTI